MNKILNKEKITTTNKPELFKVISNFKLQVQMAQFEQEMKSEEQGGQTNTELITYDGIPSMLFELREPVEKENDKEVNKIIAKIFEGGEGNKKLNPDYEHLLLFPNCANPSLIINLSNETLGESLVGESSA